MIYRYLILLCCLIAAANAGRGQHAFCEPGTSYKYDCNTCSCNAAGDYVSCTTKPCSIRSVNEITRRDFCTPGNSIKFDCNTCTCNADGQHVSCTNYICSKRRVQESRLPDEKYCHVGEMDYRDCKVCRCIPGIGFVKCTKLYCPK